MSKRTMWNASFLAGDMVSALPAHGTRDHTTSMQACTRRMLWRPRGAAACLCLALAVQLALAAAGEAADAAVDTRPLSGRDHDDDDGAAADHERSVGMRAATRDILQRQTAIVLGGRVPHDTVKTVPACQGTLIGGRIGGAVQHGDAAVSVSGAGDHDDAGAGHKLGVSGHPQMITTSGLCFTYRDLKWAVPLSQYHHRALELYSASPQLPTAAASTVSKAASGSSTATPKDPNEKLRLQLHKMRQSLDTNSTAQPADTAKLVRDQSVRAVLPIAFSPAHAQAWALLLRDEHLANVQDDSYGGIDPFLNASLVLKSIRSTAADIRSQHAAAEACRDASGDAAHARAHVALVHRNLSTGLVSLSAAESQSYLYTRQEVPIDITREQAAAPIEGQPRLPEAPSLRALRRTRDAYHKLQPCSMRNSNGGVHLLLGCTCHAVSDDVVDSVPQLTAGVRHDRELALTTQLKGLHIPHTHVDDHVGAILHAVAVTNRGSNDTASTTCTRRVGILTAPSPGDEHAGVALTSPAMSGVQEADLLDACAALFEQEWRDGRGGLRPAIRAREVSGHIASECLSSRRQRRKQLQRADSAAGSGEVLISTGKPTAADDDPVVHAALGGSKATADPAEPHAQADTGAAADHGGAHADHADGEEDEYPDDGVRSIGWWGANSWKTWWCFTSENGENCGLGGCSNSGCMSMHDNTPASLGSNYHCWWHPRHSI